MRRVLAACLLATVLLAGCGDEAGDVADEPTPSLGESAEGWHLVEIVHATAVDGRVSATPTPITNEQQVTGFSAQFSRPEMQQEIERVVRGNAPADDLQLVASVIAIGCDVPPGVTYLDGEIKPLKVPDPHLECFAPVTSVAILAVVE